MLSRPAVRWIATSILLSVIGGVAGPAGALPSTPKVRIFEAPPACCSGAWAGLVRGVATGVDLETVAIALYAETDLLYIQPFTESLLPLDAAGRFESTTRGGTDYVALLVTRGFVAPPTLSAAPEIGGSVLAIARASQDIRHLQFAGRTWGVKAAPVALGPGANIWSDAPDAVFVDAGGALHLRIAPRGDVWECAEVWTDERVATGRFRFHVATPLSSLDPNVIFSGFLFADGGEEADIEWGRFGSVASDNLRFAVQPDQFQSTTIQVDGSTTQDIAWTPAGMEFALRAATGAPLLEWRAPGPVPESNWMRLRFNLWLAGGQPPTDAMPFEVVVRDVGIAIPSAAGPALADPLGLVVANPALDGHLQFRATAGGGTPASIDIFDVHGRWLERAWHAPLTASAMTWPPRSAAGLSAGVYLVRLTTPTATVARKVVVTPRRVR